MCFHNVRYFLRRLWGWPGGERRCGLPSIVMKVYVYGSSAILLHFASSVLFQVGVCCCAMYCFVLFLCMLSLSLFSGLPRYFLSCCWCGVLLQGRARGSIANSRSAWGFSIPPPSLLLVACCVASVPVREDRRQSVTGILFRYTCIYIYIYPHT